jgi:hypothetical protein
MENELSDPDKKINLPAEEMKAGDESNLSVSGNLKAFKTNAAFTIYSPLNRFAAKQTLLIKLSPGQSAETFLKIQKHQEWALAKLKTFRGSDRFVP